MPRSTPPSDVRAGNTFAWGKLVFLIALALTVALVTLGITGTPWPRWLLAAASAL